MRYSHTPAVARGTGADVSAAIRNAFLDIDAVPRPPAGLFVINERTAYLRLCTRMTIAHEFAHALDLTLGGGSYLSETSAEIQNAFATATRFVTPYAASRVDEYFAECVRAYVEANDPKSTWPRATRKRLLAVDPAMFAIIAQLLEF